MKLRATFDSTIQGIPCGILVKSYTQMRPGRYSGPPELCYEEEPAEMEFEVLDRRGYRADWLAKKLTDRDFDRIVKEYEAILRAQEGE